MTVLCYLQDIPRFGAKEFQIMSSGQQLDIFVIRSNHNVYGYKNICPHQGLTLNWLPDLFLNHDQSLIQCSNHAALFRIEDGVCISGPCAGERLIPVTIKLDNGIVTLVDESMHIQTN